MMGEKKVVAPDYQITEQMLEQILSVTKITSESMRCALRDHFILGHPQSEVAERYGIKMQQIGPHIRRIRTKIKPAFDAYAKAVVRALRAKARPVKLPPGK